LPRRRRCRRQTLLAYFASGVGALRQTAISARKGVERFDGTIDAQKAMSAILRTGERFGMEHLIAICWASAPTTCLKFNHDRLPTFGVGAGRKAAEWRSIYRQLSAIGLIAQDLMEHGRWWVTDEGWRVLRAKPASSCARIFPPAPLARVRAARNAPRQPRPSWATLTPSCSSAEGAAHQAGAGAEGAGLCRVLRPHLIELATHRPASPRAMREIHGVRRRQARTLWRRLPRSDPQRS